jgi:hypothetical protein
MEERKSKPSHDIFFLGLLDSQLAYGVHNERYIILMKSRNVILRNFL